MLSVVTRKSDKHINWCEDNHYVFQNDKIIFGAAFDGCSTGVNSEWASKTLSLIFKQHESVYAGWNLSDLDFSNDFVMDKIVNDFLLKHVLDKMATLYVELKLTHLDFLSTMVIFLYHKENKWLYVKFLGDGFVFYRLGDEIIEIGNDENNMPNYFGYLINKPYPQVINSIEERVGYLIAGVEDFSICTDGIKSFTYKIDPEGLELRDPVHFLVDDLSLTHQKNGLVKKVNILKKEGWLLDDDLTVIRYKKQ
jgi:hypothetical protein